MKETVDRSYENEEKKGGLLIKKALFGKLEGEDLRLENGRKKSNIRCAAFAGRNIGCVN